MESVLMKYISNRASKKLVNNLIDKLEILKINSKNFNELIQDEEVILSPTTLEPFYDFLYAFDKLYDVINLNDFLKETSDSLTGNELKFWNSIKDFFEFNEKVKNQTSFLRDMDIADFKDLVSHTFNTNIMYNGFIKEYKKWDTDEVRKTEKTINTFLSCMIDDFKDFGVTIYDLNMKFNFENEKYKYIWDLCEKNKTYLMLKNITEKLNDLSNMAMFSKDEE